MDVRSSTGNNVTEGRVSHAERANRLTYERSVDFFFLFFFSVGLVTLETVPLQITGDLVERYYNVHPERRRCVRSCFWGELVFFFVCFPSTS
jgi:hypothetical protein